MKIKRTFTSNFFMMSNESAQDANLSCAAKGLLAHLLSLPADWDIHENELTRHCTDGKAAVHTAMKKLIQAGYVYKTGQREQTVYYVDTFPHTIEEWEKQINGSQPLLSTTADFQQSSLPKNRESLTRNSDKGLPEIQQSPLPKFSNDLTRNSGNTNTQIKTYTKTYNKEKEKEGAKAPAFSLSQQLNPSQKDAMARFEGIKKTWNEVGSLIPFRKLTFTHYELQNILPTLEAYSDEQVTQAICNYGVISQNPQEYAVTDHSITFVNFLHAWVERFTDEAKPYDRYKLKKQSPLPQKPQPAFFTSKPASTYKFREYDD